MQLPGICRAGQKPLEDRVKQLIALQRPNGGWGQTGNLASDAYATGEPLYALHETGMAAIQTVYRRGVDFLLRTQKEIGFWLVKTRAAWFHLKAKLERGAGQAERGELIDGNEGFDELREMIEERRRGLNFTTGFRCWADFLA